MLLLQILSISLIFYLNLSGQGFLSEEQMPFLLVALILGILPFTLKKRLPFLIVQALQLILLIWISTQNMTVRFLLPFPILHILKKTALPYRLYPVFLLLPLFQMDTPLIFPYLLGATALTSVFMSIEKYNHRQQGQTQTIENLQKELELREKNLLLERENNQNQSALAVMEERSRLSHQLHDQIGHVITGSIMQLQAVEVLLSKDPESCRKPISQTRDNLNKGMDGIRKVLRSYNPLDEEMGIGRLKKQLSDFFSKTTIQSKLEVDGPIKVITPVLWSVIHRNLTEALTNLQKYSKADLFLCKIDVLNKLIRIEFRDNGNPPSTIQYGMGLQAMEERVHALHGNLILDTSRGFSLTMLIPKERET